ncbi:MAG: hypothetical protein MHM6MM_005062 [Cercozoa sp. M6MM]
MMIKLKIEFNGEIRRTQVSNPLTMASLREAVQDMFETDIVASMARISYVDEEGDTIVVTQDIELQEAVQVFNGKAVKLRVASVEPTEATTEVPADDAASDAASEAGSDIDIDVEAVMGAAGNLLELLPEALKLFGDYLAAGVAPAAAAEKVLAEMPGLSKHADEVRRHFRAHCRRQRRCGRGRRGRGCGRGRHFHARGHAHGHGHFHGHGPGFLRRFLGGFGVRPHGMRHGGMRHCASQLGLGATFVKDVSLPDHVELPTGSVHIKTWRFQNTGTAEWPRGTQLHFVKGAYNVLQGQTAFDVPCAKPGQTVEISVPVQVPAQVPVGARRRDRRVKALFRLRAPVDGFARPLPFGDRVWLDFNVVPSDKPNDVDALVKQARETLGDRVAAFSDEELQQLLRAFDNDVDTFVRDVLGGSA